MSMTLRYNHWKYSHHPGLPLPHVRRSSCDIYTNRKYKQKYTRLFFQAFSKIESWKILEISSKITALKSSL
jgi:hypothetical protein